MKVALIVFLALVPFCLAEHVRYENYKVYRVVPKTKEDADFLTAFRQLSTQIDFWNDIRVLGHPVDIMVPPVLQDVFTSMLKLNKINYHISVQDVEKAIQDEHMRQVVTPATRNGKIDFVQYHRYDKIVSYLEQLEKDYPEIVKVEYPGNSFENRKLAMIKISTGGENKPIILVDAGIHAREWIAPANALYLINQLVENPDNRHMIENVDWHIIPVLNPDGYEYSHDDDRLWRKTRSTGKQCRGVDGNRNFDFHWMETGASSSECSDTYAGPKAMSEPESQILAKVVEEGGSRIKLYLTFHTYGNYILYPWGYTSALPEDADELQALGEKVAHAIASVDGTEYTIGSSTNVLYAAAGGSDDWVKAIGGVELSFTLEFPGGGPWGFDPPASAILPIVTETFEGLVVYHDYIEEKFVA